MFSEKGSKSTLGALLAQTSKPLPGGASRHDVLSRLLLFLRRVRALSEPCAGQPRFEQLDAPALGKLGEIEHGSYGFLAQEISRLVRPCRRQEQCKLHVYSVHKERGAGQDSWDSVFKSRQHTKRSTKDTSRHPGQERTEDPKSSQRVLIWVKHLVWLS